MIWIACIIIIFIIFIWGLMASVPKTPIDDELQMKAIEEWKDKKEGKRNA